MRRQKGIAMLEVIVVGFAVVLLVLPVIGTVARLSEAHATIHAAARDGAVWVARHGGEPPEVAGVELSVVASDDAVEVVARREVTLVGVLGSSLVHTVRATVAVPVSTYRSDP